MISIILADDHQILREALRLLLETQPDFHVVGEASDGLSAIELTGQHKPDILIVDMMMPGLSGLEVARRIKQISPDTKVIVLSMYDAESYIVESLLADVAGYVLKKSSSEELIVAIREALNGNLYLSPSLNVPAIQAYMQRSHDSRVADSLDSLTDREREVLQLAAEGLNNPEIGERLLLSPRTVEMHRGNLMRKLGLKSQTELVRYALRRGLIE